MKIIRSSRELLKTIKLLGLSILSLKVIALLALDRKLCAFGIIKKQLRSDPCNWKLSKFLLGQYRTSNDLELAIELFDQFTSASFPITSPQNINREYQFLSRLLIEAFFFSSSEEQDFCEIDFLGGSRPSSSSLHIVFAGRFSNFLVQLSNAISIASNFQIYDIYVTPSSNILNLFPDFRTVLCQKSNIKIRFTEPKSGFVVRGYFFHAIRQPDHYLYSTSTLRETVASFRHATFFPNSSSEASMVSRDIIGSNLVIHLRSGDIFESKNVHADYGQPPLSYYIISIEHFRPSCVTLVYENTLNPVIEILAKYLVDNNIPHAIHSSDLLSDLQVLSEASAFVMSRGTFASGILCINDKLHTIYCFNSRGEDDAVMKLHTLDYFYGAKFRPCRPTVFEVVDTVGEYFDSVCSKNWINSTYQRQLMLSYPIEYLEVEKLL